MKSGDFFYIVSVKGADKKTRKEDEKMNNTKNDLKKQTLFIRNIFVMDRFPKKPGDYKDSYYMHMVEETADWIIKEACYRIIRDGFGLGDALQFSGMYCSGNSRPETEDNNSTQKKTIGNILYSVDILRRDYCDEEYLKGEDLAKKLKDAPAFTETDRDDFLRENSNSGSMLLDRILCSITKDLALSIAPDYDEAKIVAEIVKRRFIGGNPDAGHPSEVVAYEVAGYFEKLYPEFWGKENGIK